MRKTPFVTGEFYHIYNRGVDKRNIFNTQYDTQRLLQSMEEFNVIEPIGSIYENSFIKNKKGAVENNSQLVNIVCFCLNSNHFHFILEQASDRGIEKFMQRLGTGYTKYFNNKNKRTGALFQGKFKSIHISTNEYLLHLSAYVNLNYRVHQLGSRTSKLTATSWDEYIGKTKNGFCKKNIILEQYNSNKEYEEFALGSLDCIIERRKEDGDINALLIE